MTKFSELKKMIVWSEFTEAGYHQYTDTCFFLNEILTFQLSRIYKHAAVRECILAPFMQVLFFSKVKSI